MSSKIRSTASAPRRLFATALGVALLPTGQAADLADNAAQALDSASADDASGRSTHRLESVDIEGVYAKKADSPKYTAPLRDTPQDIAVVPNEVIEGQNLLSLRDVLSTLPGITFGAGEGGGGFGDSINLRGFNANNDITVDGLRDSAQYSRTDAFNLQSVEVINGANSVYSGAGAVGGTVNLVTKKAEDADFTRFTAGVGTDAYRRLTADSNQHLSEGVAVRLNVMAHENDAPGREVEDFRRYGFAPSIAFGLGSDTRATLSYVHQHDDNVPQYGVPFYSGRPLPGVDASEYFGYRNVDQQVIDSDVFTAIVQHDFNEGFSVRNTTRSGEVTQLTVVDPPQGTYCLDSGINPATGAACTAPGTYVPTGNVRGNVRDTTNRTLINQTDFTTQFHTAAVKHDLVAGFSLMHETYGLNGSAELRNADGTNPYVNGVTLPVTDYRNPDTLYTGPRHRTLTSKVDGELDNRALYVFDNIAFTDSLSLNAGARYERNDGSSTAYIVKLFMAPTAAQPNPDNSNLGAITGAQTPAKNADNLFSYRAGLVWKPQEHASVYLAYGNSKTPSKASVNGSCTATSTTGTANCNVDPESAVNYELGTKWDVLDGKLSLTASLFRNDRSNYRVSDPGNPDNPLGEQQLDGHARVEGLLLGVGGLITAHWSVFANYSHLRSKVLRGASRYVSSIGQDFTRGDSLLQTPDDSLSLWTTYDLARAWQVGYGLTYQGEFYLTQHSATNLDGPLVKAPSYWTHRAMVAYKVSSDFALQLNLTNAFDKEYYTRIRNNGWATPGDARSVTLTANYTF